jgi:TolB-like protein/class 3 adenylate cyclase/predicted ATPase
VSTIRTFGPFRLDVDAEILFRGTEPTALGRRAVALLGVLLEGPGAPISKDALIEAAWSGLAVEDSNLTVQISALRRVLGDAGGANWIETMPRRGYRFVGPTVVTEQSAEAAEPQSLAAGVNTTAAEQAPVLAAQDRPSIAVLPFTNMSGDPEHEHLADGMAEDIITALSKLRWLPVAARNSTFIYKAAPVSIKQVGAELGVRFVLEGSVRISGDQMRVTGQLIEVDSGQHLWAEHYDRQINKDLFAIQDQITRHVVAATDSVIRTFESHRTSSRTAGKFNGRELARTFHGDTERRQLTAMCCELVRPPARIGGSDLEDLREAVGAYLRCISDTVGRFEGFPGRHVGNNVLVYFGYPTAHEDDAEQAVRAALELCAAIGNLNRGGGVPLQCRIGIATGPVIIGDLTEAAEAHERGIIGDAPNVATQLQAFARPGTVAIEATTRRLIGSLFEFRDLGAIEGIGASEAVPAWQVLRTSGQESRFEALRSPDLTPLVGRDEELEMLRRRWRQAAGGKGRIVLLSGEPGIGKSRLTAALQKHLQGEVHEQIRYFCSPHHQSSPLHTVINHLERNAGFANDDLPDQRLDKLAAMLGSVGLGDDDISLIAEFMSLPRGTRYPPLDLSPKRKKERILAALFHQFEGLARRRPLLIVFEDLHWIDPSSRELLDLLVGQIGRLPALLVATCRPEFQPPWTGLAQVTFVALSRLSRDDGAEMVRQISGNAVPLLQDIENEIIARADGVPLFVEELTRAAIEATADRNMETIGLTPASPPMIPMTLQASLMGRLDRLGLVTKQVAQAGAAVGREFSYELLAAAGQLPESQIREGLARLVEASLVFQRGAPPDASYLFKHVLIRDIVYGTMLRQARQEQHRNIAAALEQHFPDRVDLEPDLLAQHLAEAGQIDKAAEYFLRAGQLAIRRSAMTEAVAQLRNGLNVLSGAPDDAVRQERELNVQIALGVASIATKGYTAPDPAQAYARARQLCEQLNQPQQLGPVLGGQFAFHLTRGDLVQAHQHAEEIRRLAELGNEAMWKYAGEVVSGNVCFYLGKFIDARAHYAKALPLWNPAYRAAAVVPEDPYVVYLTFVSQTLVHLGYLDQARLRRDEALAEARQLSSFSLAFALCAAWQIDWAIKRESLAPTMLELAEELSAIANEHGFAPWSATGNIMRGWCLAKEGQAVEGISLLVQGLASVAANGSKLSIPFYLLTLAEAYGMAGQPDEGLRRLDDAARLIETTGERWAEAEMHRLRGTLLLSANEQAAAEDSYRHALAVARRQGAEVWKLRAALDIARLWQSQGKRTEARDVLAPVCGWFTEGLDIPVLQQAKALLNQLQ